MKTIHVSSRLPNRALLAVVAFSLAALSACSNSSSPTEDNNVVIDYDFRTDTLGWHAGIADYPAVQEADVDFVADHRAIPGMPTPEMALYQKGVNISDDLIMYFTKQVDGLEANREYRATFHVEFASNYGDDCAFGVGSLVFIKAGASRIEPSVAPDSNGWVRLNIDKGQQQNDGANAIILGDVRNGEPGCSATAPYAIASRDRDNASIVVRADDNGRVWLLLATESAFESVHHLFFTRLTATLKPL